MCAGEGLCGWGRLSQRHLHYSERRQWSHKEDVRHAVTYCFAHKVTECGTDEGADEGAERSADEGADEGAQQGTHGGADEGADACADASSLRGRQPLLLAGGG